MLIESAPLTPKTIDLVEKLLFREDVYHFRNQLSVIERRRLLASSAKYLTPKGWVLIILSKDQNANVSLSLQEVR